MIRLFAWLNWACLFYLTPVCAIAYLLHQLGLSQGWAFFGTAVGFPVAVDVLNLKRRT